MDTTAIAITALVYFTLALYASIMRWLYLKTRCKLNELQAQLKTEELESKGTFQYSKEVKHKTNNTNNSETNTKKPCVPTTVTSEQCTAHSSCQQEDKDFPEEISKIHRGCNVADKTTRCQPKSRRTHCRCFHRC